MKVLVDDIRDMKVYGADMVFRTANDFLRNIPKNITTLFLDHDLGPGKTGYDVIVALVENRRIRPNIVIIVSSNPVGVENIGRCLMANGYNKVTNRNYIFLGEK